jgi:putative DNA primase/helicase
MSNAHPNYDPDETELKIKQALAASGPRTCKDIDTRWAGCTNCANYGVLSSPIAIHGPDYIRSKDSGYRIETFDAEGKPKVGKPAYDDLLKKFEKDNPYISVSDTRTVHIFNGKHWQEFPDPFIDEWTTSLVRPAPSGSEMDEMRRRIKAHNVKTLDWFKEAAFRKMNFQNGVLDLSTMQLSSHSPDYGFTTVLPYGYDPQAACPMWDKFIDDVSMGDAKMRAVLEQFGGYAIAGGECLAQKALILLGNGSNGKSVYAETIGKVVGAENYSTLMLHHLFNDQMRYLLVNKLFNYADETNPKALSAAGEFKSLVTGGETTAKQVYKPAFIFKNRAKFIVLANDLPRTDDYSDGMFRRLLIVKFKRKFEGSSDNKALKSQMEKELPGICNRLIAGYNELVRNNYVFDEPEQSKLELAAYREENNNVLCFIRDSIEFDAASAVSNNDIYMAYRSYCDMSGDKNILNNVWFFRLLRRGAASYGVDIQFERTRSTKTVKGIKLIDTGEM